MFKVGENYQVKSELLSAMLYAFAGQMNVDLVNYISDEYYSKLPLENQNKEFIVYINNMLKAVVGMKAPELFWDENGVEKSLMGLEAKAYIVVFWSTTCSHCLDEIPKLYKFTQDFEGLQVIAVALEDLKVEFDKLILTMPNWIHVYGKGKWQNEFAKSYNVNSTPSYFVLDQDKKIIAKPEELEDLMEIFQQE